MDVVKWFVNRYSEHFKKILPMDRPRIAVQIFNQLLEKKYFHHVHRQHAFKNEYLFYRFVIF